MIGSWGSATHGRQVVRPGRVPATRRHSGTYGDASRNIMRGPGQFNITCRSSSTPRSAGPISSCAARRVPPRTTRSSSATRATSTLPTPPRSPRCCKPACALCGTTERNIQFAAKLSFDRLSRSLRRAPARRAVYGGDAGQNRSGFRTSAVCPRNSRSLGSLSSAAPPRARSRRTQHGRGFPARRRQRRRSRDVFRRTRACCTRGWPTPTRTLLLPDVYPATTRPEGSIYRPHNSGADNYPTVATAWFTDHALYEGASPGARNEIRFTSAEDGIRRSERRQERRAAEPVRGREYQGRPRGHHRAAGARRGTTAWPT